MFRLGMSLYPNPVVSEGPGHREYLSTPDKQRESHTGQLEQLHCPLGQEQLPEVVQPQSGIMMVVFANLMREFEKVIW